MSTHIAFSLSLPLSLAQKQNKYYNQEPKFGHVGNVSFVLLLAVICAGVCPFFDFGAGPENMCVCCQTV